MSATKSPQGPTDSGSAPVWRSVLARAAEVAVLLLVAGFLFFALRGDHPDTSVIAEHMINNATEETGALNLVTAIYLEYRLFDTLGETIVLLLAVSGVMVLLEERG